MVVHTKHSPDSFLESESYHEPISDGLSNVILEVRDSSEKISIDVSKDGSSVKTTATNTVVPKTLFYLCPCQGQELQNIIIMFRL